MLHTKGGAVRWFKVSPARGDDAAELKPLDRALAPFALVAGGLAQAAVHRRALERPAAVVAATAVAGRAGLALRAARAAPAAWRAALLGWLFATAWLCGTFWWLFISMHTYGGLAAPLAAIAVLALAAFLALYYAPPARCSRRCAPASPLARGCAFRRAVDCWPNCCAARWFTGFPWGAGGYAHVDGPLSALAPWIGVYGIGVVAALLAYAAGAGLRHARGARSLALLGWRWSAVVALLAACNLAAAPGRRRGPAARCSRRAAAGQHPAGREVPGRHRHPDGAATGTASSCATPRRRWWSRPRPPFRCCPRNCPTATWRRCARASRSGKQAALIGIPLGRLQRRLHQFGASGFKPGEPTLYRYDKHHLVPFGEFIPPLFRWFTDMMNIPLGDFNRGALGQRLFEWQGQRIAPNICYEDLFGEETGRAASRDPADAPTIFVNVSNIGWFGDTVAIDQHLQISRMRALEFERPDDARHQHRRHGDHRPPRPGDACAAALHARRADRRGRRANARSRPMPGGCRAWACGRCGCWRSIVGHRGVAAQGRLRRRIASPARTVKSTVCPRAFPAC